MKKCLQRSSVLLMVMVLIACGESTGSKNLEKARQYLLKGENKAAIIELKNSLQKNEKNGEARWLLGKTYLDSRDYENAIKELNLALELGQPQNDVIPLLAQTYLAVDDLKKLKELSIDNLTSPESRSLFLASQGLGLLREGRLEEATSLIALAIKEDPQSVFALLAQARVLAIQSGGEFSLLREKLNEILEINPRYAPALSLLADVEFQAGRLNLAEQSYTKAIKAGSNKLDDYYKRALIRMQMGNILGAGEDIDMLNERIPSHPGVHYLKGLLYFQQQNIKDAISSFEVSSKAEDQYPMALLYLGLAYEMEGSLSRAEDIVYRFLSIAPENAIGRKLLARLKVNSGEVGEAEELLAPVLTKNPDDVEALNIFAKALMKQGKRQEAIKLLAKVAKLQPDSAEARLNLGASMLSTDQDDIGLEFIESASDLNPQLKEADILIIAAHFRDGDFAGALKAVDKFAEKNPDSEVPYNLRGKIYLASQREQQARESFAKALEVTPGNLIATHALAFLAAKDGHKDKARDYYNKALEYHENDLTVLAKLIALEEIDKNYDAMLDYMKRGLEAHPDSIYLKVLMARYHILQGKPEQVPVVLGNLTKDQRKQPDVLNVLGLSQLHRGQFREAKDSFQQLSELRSDAPQPLYHLGNAYLSLGDQSRALENFKAALDLFPAYIPARVELTKILLEHQKVKEVSEQLSILKEIAPDSPEVMQLEASKYRLEGNQGRALVLSAQAYKEMPSARNMMILSRQNLVMGNRDQGLELLKSWISDNPDDIAPRLDLANLFLNEGKNDLAAEQYNAVLVLDKQNRVALNNLAWLLADTDKKLALKYAEQVVDLESNSATALDTLAVVLFKNGEFVKAKRFIDRALKLEPANPEIRYHNAMIIAESGDKDSAKKLLQNLLGGNTPFPQRQEAEALLKTL